MKYKIFQNSDKIIKFLCETLKFGEKFKPNAQRIAIPLPPNRTGVQRGHKCTLSTEGKVRENPRLATRVQCPYVTCRYVNEGSRSFHSYRKTPTYYQGLLLS